MPVCVAWYSERFVCVNASGEVWYQHKYLSTRIFDDLKSSLPQYKDIYQAAWNMSDLKVYLDLGTWRTEIIGDI